MARLKDITSAPPPLYRGLTPLLTCKPYVKPNQSGTEDTVTAYTLVN